MEFHARYEVDVVALQADEAVTCLLTLTAPSHDELADRPGETLIVVVDESGSMSGAPMASVRLALHQLVDRLKPQDTFGLVAFSAQARIVVPARSVRQHHLPSVHDLIEDLVGRSSTDLSAGYLLGLEQARRHASPSGASIMLLSDGHANAGVVDPATLGSLAAQARQQGGTTVTIGIGSGYDESLLHELSLHGQGAHRFAHTPDDCVAVVGEEAGDLLAKAIVNAFLRIHPNDPELIDRIGTLHGVPRWIEQSPQGPSIVIPLGDLYAGQTQEVLVQLQVPALDQLGQQVLGEFVIDYVAMPTADSPSMQARTVTWPLAVNVVPDAADRIPDPTVTCARLLAQATTAKREASEALAQLDTDRAQRLVSAEAVQIRRAAGDLAARHPQDPQVAERLEEEARQLDKLAAACRERQAHVSRKSLMEDVAMNSSGRSDEMRRRRARGKREF